MTKRKILIVFGTRPEAIKMALLIKEFQKCAEFEVKVCVTAQHRQMLDQVLEFFEIKPDFDLNLMKQGQDLYDITSGVLLGMRDVFGEYTPDIVFVHGDTTTTYAVSLAAYYQKIDVAHVEAGLRTHDIYSPFPEEINRQMTGLIAKYHFAPTADARDNLLKEGKDSKNIIVSGNTVIDALLWTIDKIENNELLKNKILSFINAKYKLSDRRFILVTGHRRENFGEGFVNICEALREIALKNENIDIVYPVHLNPNVRKPVGEILSGISNIFLIDPLEYDSFVYLMSKSYMIVTDSGGIQEEAPSLCKPVLVIRETTERPEGIRVGCVKLIGTKRENIIKEVQKLLNLKDEYDKMSKSVSPYGDGKTCKKILEFLKGIL
ncbi:UDP-N-acetylglucosamine 2-epimerase (non-hydrolyzing) [uncultured Campylobacter sp.]|uniref:non-hydrolyzing UDP-N-acetylglucosamine 2-epimerase n=1 Tax=uncultured Campylobacter sp. TaxID=218934 RepID=UPI00261705A8|nr:UDP-N-acetylglucosamine 2-epimerase (non-hydrolyzing) [uncultured Campylobacter sp.]